MPADAAQAVLQMPRGNLEAVAPRVLVLAHIADRLQVTTACNLLLAAVQPL